MSPKDIYENRKNLSSEFFTKKQIEKAAKHAKDEKRKLKVRIDTLKNSGIIY